MWGLRMFEGLVFYRGGLGVSSVAGGGTFSPFLGSSNHAIMAPVLPRSSALGLRLRMRFWGVQHLRG